jgi:hypothetical protein
MREIVSGMSSEISTYQDLKRHSATMGMVFFGLLYDKAIPDRDKLIELGISVCDVVAEGPQLTTSGPVSTYQELTAGRAFSVIAHGQTVRADQLSLMGEDAASVKETLQRLRNGERVPIEALDISASFFNKVYNAT